MSNFLSLLKEVFHNFVFVPSVNNDDGPQLASFANWTCCTTCANYEALEWVINRNKGEIQSAIDESDEQFDETDKDQAIEKLGSRLYLGFINWHNQEDDNVKKNNRQDIWLGYGIMDENSIHIGNNL